MRESAQRRLLAWAAGSVEGPFMAGIGKLREKRVWRVEEAPVLAKADLQNL